VAAPRRRPDPRRSVDARAQAPHATILAHSGLPLPPISTEADFFAEIGRIPLAMPGTQELTDRIVEATGEGWALSPVSESAPRPRFDEILAPDSDQASLSDVR
jgi:hypothetical protein